MGRSTAGHEGNCGPSDSLALARRPAAVSETGAVVGADGSDEEQLPGGVANQGSVVRVGDTVRRPAGPWSATTRSLLGHLEAVGFDEAPRYLGTDARGRDVFSYIDGVVPLPPFPAWSMTDEVLADLAGLLGRFHRAVGSFDPGDPAAWSSELADPQGGAVVCHNDVCPENVVFRDGRAVGLVDFDFAAPGRPAWDVVRTIVMWAPMTDPRYRRDFPSGLDAVGRLARFVSAYGLEPDQADEVVDLLIETRLTGRRFVERHIAAGERAFIEMWERAGGAERERRNDELVSVIARRWWRPSAPTHRPAAPPPGRGPEAADR